MEFCPLLRHFKCLYDDEHIGRMGLHITTQQAMVPFLSDHYTRKDISKWGTSSDPEDKGKCSESKAARYLPKISLIASC